MSGAQQHDVRELKRWTIFPLEESSPWLKHGGCWWILSVVTASYGSNSVQSKGSCLSSSESRFLWDVREWAVELESLKHYLLKYMATIVDWELARYCWSHDGLCCQKCSSKTKGRATMSRQRHCWSHDGLCCQNCSSKTKGRTTMSRQRRECLRHCFHDAPTNNWTVRMKQATSQRMV